MLIYVELTILANYRLVNLIEVSKCFSGMHVILCVVHYEIMISKNGNNIMLNVEKHSLQSSDELSLMFMKVQLLPSLE